MKEGVYPTYSRYFPGLYGDFEIARNTGFYPAVAFLLRNGKDVKDQTVATVLVGSSF